MPKLTPSQKAFLNDFLSARARKKGVLGGRDLAKVKDAFKDYCQRRQKVTEAIRELEALPLGSELAAPFDKALGAIDNRIDAASDAGDESVFAQSYNELETIKKDVGKALDGRKAELKKIAAAVESFQADLEKVRTQSNPAKKQAQAAALRDSTGTWIGEHHGSDTLSVWGVFQAATEFAGGPGPNGLAVAARELDSEAFAIAKQIEAFSARDIQGKTRMVKDCIFELGRLDQRLQKFKKSAAESGNSFVCAQLEKTQAMVTRSQWMIDPPPLPTVIPPLATAQQPQQVALLDVSQVAPEKLTNAQLADRTLKKSQGLVQHVDEELKRVKNNLAEVKSTVTNLKQLAKPCAELLAADIDLLDYALKDADSELAGATTQAKTAHDEVDQGDTNKDTEGKWEDHLKAAGNALNTALASLAMCEKFTGQAEGGVVYLQRSIESIQSIKTRVAAVDAALLSAVQARIGLLPDCAKVPVQGAELDMVKHLMFTSNLPPDKLKSLLATGLDANSVKQMTRKLMESPKLGTMAVTEMLARCHQLLVDAERYYGSQKAARKALDSDDLKNRFDAICALAKQDVAQFTIPVIALTEEDEETGRTQSVGVAVVGGGPVGLLAAVEARMAGASQVHVYEGRNDPYSRMNVLKIDEAPARRLFAAGVSDAVFPTGYDPADVNKHIASVKTIEEALEARCGNLGIKLERGLFLKDVTRDPSKKVLLHFKGEDQPKTCDVLIVATGGSVASAQKYADNVVLSDKLGIPFQKAAVKDYAAVGLFQKEAPTPDTKGHTQGWAYEFETHEVKYIVTQLTEEEYNALSKDPRGLIERLQHDAEANKLAKRPDNAPPVRKSTASKTANITADQIDAEIDTAWDHVLLDIGPNNFFGKDVETDQDKITKAKVKAKESLTKTLAAKKQKKEPEKLSPLEVEDAVLQFLTLELGAARFPIEIQQAQQFASADLSGVLVGDSAATPHPDTSKGFNTGVAEMGAVRDLVQDLSRGTGSEKDRKQAMQMYEWEVKRRTDFLVTEGLNALQVRGRDRIKTLWYKTFWPLLKETVDTPAREEWYKKAVAYLQSFSVDREAAKDDRDWALREDAVKKTRAFEASMHTARTAIELLLQGNEKDPAKLMAPLEALLPG